MSNDLSWQQEAKWRSILAIHHAFITEESGKVESRTFSEICKRSGLGKATVSVRLRELTEKGLVEDGQPIINDGHLIRTYEWISGPPAWVFKVETPEVARIYHSDDVKEIIAMDIGRIIDPGDGKSPYFRSEKSQIYRRKDKKPYLLPLDTEE